MAKSTEPMPGTSDLFPEECQVWQLLEDTAHELFPRYGYGELRTPIFERTDVFLRSIGDETDIVQKEMYTFRDRGNRSLTLRPEGTAGVMRALANQGIPQGDERRVYYLGPMFRGERPAAGRKRQFHQVGTECVGKSAPFIDVENIRMLLHYLSTVGIDPSSMRLLLNSRGTREDRQPVADALRAHFEQHVSDMCEDCQRRLTTNVWRILDCKVESCAPFIEAAPSTTDLLCQESRDYFQQVCGGLDELGVDYTVDPRLVRGLDYYVHTVFEVVFAGIGAQNSIAGGGRYEINLRGVSQPVEGVGFAAGLERILLAREELSVTPPAALPVHVFLVSLGDQALRRNLRLADALREAGLTALMDLEGRGMRSQMRNANKVDARYTLILGEDELKREVVVCKNMESSEQVDFPLAEVVAHLRSACGLS